MSNRADSQDKPTPKASGNQADNFSDPTDEGELQIAVYVKDGVVVIDFGKDLSWIGLDRPTLEPFIKALQETVSYRIFQRNWKNILILIN